MNPAANAPPAGSGASGCWSFYKRSLKGGGEEQDLEILEQLALLMKNGSLCALGRTAPNPLLSTLRLFRDEYLAHIKERRCPAGVCRSLVRPWINPELCKACGLCARVCPAEAINGEKGVPYEIDLEKCCDCLRCLKECPFNAISQGGISRAEAVD